MSLPGPAPDAVPDPAPASPRGGPPAFNVPPATLALALILVAMYALLHLLPHGMGAALGGRLAFNAAVLVNAIDGPIPLSRALPPLVTHMFVHTDALHLAVNVGFLVAFASVVERRLGRIAFLALFLAAGAAGALFETWFFPDAATRAVPMIGASGGVMGLMGTALLIGPAPPPGQRPAVGRLPPLNRALLRIVLALIGLNVVIGLLSEFGLTGPYLIGWRAHLGGFALGLAVGGAIRLGARRF